MKTVKLTALVAGLALSSMAFAADPIVGKWKISEKGAEKAIITISQSGDTFSAVVTEGLTEKAKKTKGQQIMHSIKAQGGGKYKGKGRHPTLKVSGNVNITVNGNTITIKSITGTQTGVKQ